MDQQEESKKRGRISNAERLGRYRSGSLGNVGSLGSLGELNELWKRKREEVDGKASEEEEERAFSKSRKTAHSPEKVQGEGRLERLIELMREELRKGIEEMKCQGGKVEEEVRQLKAQIERGQERWKKERDELRRELGALEDRMRVRDRERDELAERVNQLEAKAEAEEGGRREERGGAGDEDRRIRAIERKLEVKERDEKKKNVVIKRIKVGTEGPEEVAGEILRSIEVEATISKARAVGRWEPGREGMMVVELGSEGEKKEVMKNKGKLRGRREIVEGDLRGDSGRRTPEGKERESGVQKDSDKRRMVVLG